MEKKRVVSPRKKPDAIEDVKAADGVKATKSAKASAQTSARATTSKQQFPIVGIGASAGGLEALNEFFRQVPANCGLPFVVIQHIDPTRKGVMHELLALLSHN